MDNKETISNQPYLLLDRTHMFWSSTLNLTTSTEWHDHDIIELIFCRSGFGHFLVNQGDIELCNGRMVIVAPGFRHRFLLGEGEAVEVKIVCLRQDEAAIHLSATQNAILGRAKISGALPIDYPKQDAWLWELVDRIPDTLGEEITGEPGMAWGLVGLLVAEANRRPDICDKGSFEGYTKKMDELCAWIDANLTQPERLDVLAAKFGMSRSLLTREFRRHTGMSIVSYVNSRRLQRAGSVLMASEKSILAVSLEFGFASLPNFYKQFKALYGVTPAEFRNQLVGNATPD